MNLDGSFFAWISSQWCVKLYVSCEGAEFCFASLAAVSFLFCLVFLHSFRKQGINRLSMEMKCVFDKWLWRDMIDRMSTKTKEWVIQGVCHTRVITTFLRAATVKNQCVRCQSSFEDIQELLALYTRSWRSALTEVCNTTLEVVECRRLETIAIQTHSHFTFAVHKYAKRHALAFCLTPYSNFC